MSFKKTIPHILLATAFTVFILGFEYLVTRHIGWFGGAVFFLFILCTTLFLKHFRILYAIVLLLSFGHALFFSYFHRAITHTDIKLFFSHIQETFESFLALPSLFVLPFVFLILGVLFLLSTKWVKLQPLEWHRKQMYGVLLLLLLLNLGGGTSGTMGFGLLYAAMASSSSADRQYRENDIPRYPIRETDYNIVLLIGESMRYDAYVEEKLKKLGFFYKKIYSGATNTDVVVPLLLNAKNNTLFLSRKNETNLFRLAKKSGYETHMISMQTPREGRYIKPYLQTENIDHYKSYTDEQRDPLYDSLLLDELSHIDFSTKQFVVMQQIGQHSPYKYFNGEKSEQPKENYQRSIDASFTLYAGIYDFLQKKKKPFVFIYVSDHGEFVGEGGRYGHNAFEPMVYEVPLFIASNSALPKAYKAVRSQYHLSQLLTYLLGYGKELTFSTKKFVINGTMLSREDGFIEIAY